MNHVKGETVVYGATGVCTIQEITEISFFNERPKKYYVLKPLFNKQAAVLYVPFDNEEMTSRMKPVISRDEAMSLISSVDEKTIEWIDDKNVRKSMFNKIISSGTREEIIALIRLINQRRDELSAEGKRLNMQDEKALAEAERRMNAEIAVALNIEPDKVAELFLEEAQKRLA